MVKARILWTDDEIDLLQGHVLFLKDKGYDVETCTNGPDTIKILRENQFDIVFLDENMPGLSGIETMKMIKDQWPSLPVIMITKSEEEDIMESAIGSRFDDFLIKPVNPNQILHAIKKRLDKKRLIAESVLAGFRSEFTRIGELITMARTWNDWTDLYRKLSSWQAEIEKMEDTGLEEILESLENDASSGFSRFITSNYEGWIRNPGHDTPLLSHKLFEKNLFPLLNDDKPVFFILVDNLRFDQWKSISGELEGIFRIIREDMYCSILPTTTQFSRNSIFAGLSPINIKKRYPELWVDDNRDENKNASEKRLLELHLKSAGLTKKWHYEKIGTNAEGKKVVENCTNLLNNDLNFLVYYFVDQLSHARTEIGIMKDLAGDEAAYRSLTRSWFIHSSLLELLRFLSTKRVRVIITTDHGNIRVKSPRKVIGDKETSPSLRYKHGRNLGYDPSDVYEVTDPSRIELPSSTITSKYIFARNADYLVYQNNYNHFATYFRDTFQHGGISMQEMILPYIIMEPI